MKHVLAAHRLFETVKDVPKEAWPSGVYCHKGLWWKHQPYDDGTRSSRLGPQTAEAAFVGSMLAFLPLGWVIGQCEGHDCPDGRNATHMAYDVTDTECVREVLGASLLETLAAVCKEVKA